MQIELDLDSDDKALVKAAIVCGLNTMVIMDRAPQKGVSIPSGRARHSIHAIAVSVEQLNKGYLDGCTFAVNITYDGGKFIYNRVDYNAVVIDTKE